MNMFMILCARLNRTREWVFFLSVTLFSSVLIWFQVLTTSLPLQQSDNCRNISDQEKCKVIINCLVSPGVGENQGITVVMTHWHPWVYWVLTSFHRVYVLLGVRGQGATSVRQPHDSQLASKKEIEGRGISVTHILNSPVLLVLDLELLGRPVCSVEPGQRLKHLPVKCPSVPVCGATPCYCSPLVHFVSSICRHNSLRCSCCQVKWLYSLSEWFTASPTNDTIRSN